MNLKQLTKHEGKLLKFIRLAKNLQANSYNNKLRIALGGARAMSVFFARPYQLLQETEESFQKCTFPVLLT